MSQIAPQMTQPLPAANCIYKELLPARSQPCSDSEVAALHCVARLTTNILYKEVPL